MFYLIFCSLVLTIEVMRLIFYFCPIMTAINYEYMYEAKESIVYYLAEGELSSFLSLVVTVISIILVIILLVNNIKVFSDRQIGTMFSFVFGLIFTVILVVQLIVFVKFRNTITEWGYFGYYSYSKPSHLCNAILILFIFALILSALMLFISAVYNFTTELRKSIFFNMRSKKCSENKFGQDELVINDEKSAQKNNSDIDLLLRYNELKNQGIISEEEFNEKKKELL